MEWVVIEHPLSRIEKFGYDKTTKELAVVFKERGLYRYLKVELYHFDAMKKLAVEQRSVGKYLTDNIFKIYDQKNPTKNGDRIE